MLRRSFFKAVGVALAVLAAAYVPGRPWEMEESIRLPLPGPMRGVRAKAVIYDEWATWAPNDPLRRT